MLLHVTMYARRPVACVCEYLVDASRLLLIQAKHQDPLHTPLDWRLEGFHGSNI